MAIVTISSKYQGGREELAQALARKTNWPVMCREDLLERARKQGIKIGRLEMSIIKRPVLSDKLAREKELYLAFLTASLCEQALKGNFIYHGRAGHLLLQGVSPKLRVGLTVPKEVRISRAAQALSLTPEKAEAYLDQLDEDIGKWIRYIHQKNGQDPDQFDVFLNLENIGLSNAAGILCEMAKLPDFQPTPASMQLLNDLYLSSQAKLRLALDERTSAAPLQVKASKGVITVMYPPHQAQVSQHIPHMLGDLPGCREIQCTMAETNILWVQERFDPESDNFQQIIQLSQRWGAAVELLRLLPPGELIGISTDAASQSNNSFKRKECFLADGGVEDDEPDSAANDGGLNRTQEELVNIGRFGGQHTVCGGYHKILERVQTSTDYALVVIGNMFLSKGHSVRARQTRELAINIRDRLKAPLITADELESRFLFGKRQAIKLLGFIAMVVLVYGLVFTHQKQVATFLSGPIHQQNKWLAPALMVLFIPCLAYIYGRVAELALKIINID